MQIMGLQTFYGKGPYPLLQLVREPHVGEEGV
jgi:hypothetical protein